ncbi:MAG: D-aminoacyl-tRNA deacylase, partial [Raoultibacter sp.]
MRALIQRVSEACVTIAGETVGSINKGYLILLGVGHEDTEAQADKLWSKSIKLRIFEDEDGKTNLSLDAIGGEELVV